MCRLQEISEVSRTFHERKRLRGKERKILLITVYLDKARPYPPQKKREMNKLSLYLVNKDGVDQSDWQIEGNADGCPSTAFLRVFEIYANEMLKKGCHYVEKIHYGTRL